MGTFLGGFAEIFRYGEILPILVMLVERRDLQACLEPGRASSVTVPASHTALLMLLHPDLLLQHCGEQSETLPSPDLQIRRHVAYLGCACLPARVQTMWMKPLRGASLDHHCHASLWTLARV